MAIKKRVSCGWIVWGALVSLILVSPVSSEASPNGELDGPDSILLLLWSGLRRFVLRLLDGAGSRERQATEKTETMASGGSDAAGEIDDEVWGLNGDNSE